MKLTVGERLPGTGPPHQPGGYLVTSVVAETPWYGLYAGKKIFYNFDFTSKRPRETDDKEWLDVYLRTIHYPVLDDAAYVSRRRTLARAEARRVLANRGSNLWPEPIDVLDLHNTRDPFSFRARDEMEPVLVFARPQGQNLLDWQNNVLPLSSILGVIAELLEFIRLAHDEGLLLNGLSPATVIVDQADRVHYVGTDMVLDVREDSDRAGVRRSALGRPQFTAEEWPRFFPAQRFARGYAPPESVQPSSLPDRRGDLYAWACIAYSLLTGDKPEQAAQEQEQWWTRFTDYHFDKLEKALRTMPPAHVRNWGDQLGVSGADLVQGWPGNLITLFRLLLAADAKVRPTAVPELRSWVLAPPPPPVPAVLALRLSTAAKGSFAGQTATYYSVARLFFDLGAVDPVSQLVVRRGVGAPPRNLDDGAAVYEGQLAGVIDDKNLPVGSSAIFYSIFTRRPLTPAPLPAAGERGRGEGQRWSVSRGLEVELIDPMPSPLLTLAEAEANAATDDTEPARIALLFQALVTDVVAETLLESIVPRVRAWAVHRLVVSLESTPRGQGLLWRALRDPVMSIRLEAARGLLTGSKPATLEVVLRVLETIGADSLDEAIQAGEALRTQGVSPDLLRAALTTLEESRPTTCPVCNIELTTRDRFSHLVQTHGYVQVDGTLLPRPTAFARLWDKALLEGDTNANHRLVEICSGAVGPKGYVAELEAELGRRGGEADRRREMLEHLRRHLRRESNWPQLVPFLARSAQPQIGELGRDLLLPDLGNRLRGPATTAADIRRNLDDALPFDDLLEEKLAVCSKLASFGVDLNAANECLAQLQAERPIVCGECQQKVRQSDLETHLRRAHKIFQFRGQRRSYQEMRDHLLECLGGTSPDFEAWRVLEAIARDKSAADADKKLLEWIGKILRASEAQQRRSVLGALAEAIAAAESGDGLLMQLALPQEPPGLQALCRHLALEIAARLPPPIAAPAIEALHPLLAEKQIPRESRLATTAALLRSTGGAGPAARALLLAYVAGSGKLRAIEKLQELEQRAGKVPVIEILTAEFEDQVRMNCPRCGIELPRLHMIPHLWHEHRLVLEGRRVREPWRMIDDWIEDYRLERDAAILERCRELAMRLEGNDGLVRLQCVLLKHGIEDRDSLVILLEQARKARASLCPHCFERVPVKDPPEPPSLAMDGNSLELQDYHVTISETGLWPWVHVETPKAIVFEGNESAARLTRNGALVLVAAPIALVAFVLTEVALGLVLPASIVVLIGVSVALFVGLFMFFLWPRALNLRDRLVDQAWTHLVPELCRENLTAGGADFLAGLAKLSAHLGRRKPRVRELPEALRSLEALVRKKPDFYPHLAILTRLHVHDLLHADDDPLTLLADQVGSCFEGKLPLAYAGLLLADLAPGQADEEPAAWWSKALRRRFALLLCARAFTAGLEVTDLIDLGRVCPALGKALAVEDVETLCQRRLLYAMGDKTPWESCGQATPVFALEDDDPAPARFPDLVLAVKGLSVFMCGRGLWYEDTWFTEMPKSFAVVPRRSNEPGYELRIDGYTFRVAENPSKLTERLERWCHYYFNEFQPRAAGVLGWRSADVVRRLMNVNAVVCPECRRRSMPRLGEVGVALEAPRRQHTNLSA
jgi:hypothetical protein